MEGLGGYESTMRTLRPELNCVPMDSDYLIDNLRHSYLHHPSQKGYNHTMIPPPDPSNHSSYYYSQYGQDRFLEKFIFKGSLHGGFFLEAGAVDGVDDSNTLAFELKYEWS